MNPEVRLIVEKALEEVFKQLEAKQLVKAQNESDLCVMLTMISQTLEQGVSSRDICVGLTRIVREMEEDIRKQQKLALAQQEAANGTSEESNTKH